MNKQLFKILSKEAINLTLRKRQLRVKAVKSTGAGKSQHGLNLSTVCEILFILLPYTLYASNAKIYLSTILKKLWQDLARYIKPKFFYRQPLKLKVLSELNNKKRKAFWLFFFYYLEIFSSISLFNSAVSFTVGSKSFIFPMYLVSMFAVVIGTDLGKFKDVEAGNTVT